MSEPGDHTLKEQFAAVSRKLDMAREAKTAQALAIDGGGHHDLNMERLAKLEGIVDGLKAITPVRTAAIIAFTAAVIGGFGLMFAQISRTESRLETRADRLDAKFDALNGKVDALPEQINASIREANRAFSDALNTSLAVFSQRLGQPSVAAPPTPSAPQQQKP